MRETKDKIQTTNCGMNDKALNQANDKNEIKFGILERWKTG